MVGALVLTLVGCGPTPTDIRSAPDADLVESLPTPGSTPADPTDPTDPPVTTPPPDVTTPEDDGCATGLVCVESLPFEDTSTTTGGASDLDSYGCAPSTDESGPEVVYQVELTEPGLIVASLSGLGSGVDVDVHLLQSLDSGDCIDRGHWDSVAWLEAGTFYVTVDSWVDGSGTALAGDYTLRVQQILPTDGLAAGLAETVFDDALHAFDWAWAHQETTELEYGIVDYTLPSTEPRFFVLDLRYGDLLWAELATHGSGGQDPNDDRMMIAASNVSGSNTSSVGLVRTAETYYGSNGYSLRLDGLESGFNDNDRPRAIVIHGADYATQDFVDTYGYLGRSWGCPAVDDAISDAFIDTLAEGRLVFKYFDDPDWLATSAVRGGR